MYGSGGRTRRQRRVLTRLKTHVGIDGRTKLIHTVLASAANLADCEALQYLLHGRERRAWGDQAYRGQRAAIRAGAPRAKDFTNQRFRWGKRIDESVEATNPRKSSVRAKVEHVFGVIKRVFGFQKVCYRGLAKNLGRLEVTAALTNLFLVRRRRLHSECRCRRKMSHPDM
jgi:IS5 family transposase